METTTLPSIKQMANRANTGHISALRAVADGRPACSPSSPASELRGIRKILGTLQRWDCVAADYSLTERGHELLNLIDPKAAR